MRLIVLLGVLAVAAADYQQPYYGPQHIPVIQNGVPVEPQAVQAARAAHLAALGGAAHGAPYAGAGQWNGNNGQWNGNNQNAAPQQGRWTPPAYQTSHVQPKIGQDGQPLDTPEVQAAKANHFAAYSQQHAALGQAYASAQPSGQYGGGGHYRKRRSVYGGYGGHGYAVPQIGPNGVPLDTPEVQHAKAAHFAAVAEAASRAGAGGYGGDGSYDDGSYDGRYDGAYDGGNGAGGHAVWNGPIHIPVIGPNGVPVEPAAVQHARAAHLAALHDAGARAGHGYGYGGYGHY